MYAKKVNDSFEAILRNIEIIQLRWEQCDSILMNKWKKLKDTHNQQDKSLT